MRLRRLDISGFKSFVDPVSLTFPGGITGIVGPNGCGKSNISDAISWVLGEQSAKSLRSSSMEDVIFNGSERRKPLGMAEVTLTLEVDPEIELAENGVVTISRRVFRGGEGQYRMNGKRTRLKEIRDFLMGTGLGLRAYSIIEQGKIGMILSGKPQERRRLIEEAAGVTRYKERRRIAELKLQDATANLLRLDDIISEVERALRSLKRQAGAARRYQERKEQLDELLERVFLGRWARLRGRIEGLDSTLAAHGEAEAEVVADLKRRDEGLAAERERIESLAADVAELHRRDAELDARIEGRQQLLESARENLDQIAERLTAGDAMAEERARNQERRAEARIELERRRTELMMEREEALSAVAGDESALTEHATSVRAAETALSSTRTQLLEATNALNAARSEHHRRQVEAERANLRRQHLDEELREHEAELRQAKETVETTSASVVEIETAIAGLRSRRESLEAELEAVLGRETTLAREHREIQEILGSLRQREAVLAGLEEAHAESRQRLEEALEEFGLAEPTFLADRLRPREGWERSLDHFFGDLADAVVVPEGVDPLELAQVLAEAGVKAILVRERGEVAAADAPSDPAIVGTLPTMLQVEGGLTTALPPTCLVETAEEAERLASAHPGFAFVSRAGLWAQAGLLHVEGARSQPGILERKNEREEIHRDLPIRERALEAKQSEVDEAVEQRTRKAEEIHRLEQELHDARRSLAVAQARKEDAADRLRRLEKQSKTYESERGKVLREIEAGSERLRDLEEQLASRVARQKELEEEQDRSREALEEARQEREQLRAAGAERRGQLELLEERVRSLAQDLNRIDRESAEAAEHVERWSRDRRELLDRRERLRASLAEAEQELMTARDLRKGSEGEVEAAEGKLREAREHLKEVETAAVVRREEREGLRDQAEAYRVELAGLQQDARHLREEFREKLGAEIPDPPPPFEGDLEELEGELAKIRENLERIGPVNVLAAQEYEEQEERHGYLTEQRRDVADSVTRLKTTIREINETSSERFRETFEAVNARFGEVFTALFNGGEAEMRLLDEEDLLEAGIEIVARPPGKRLQNLLLMSGGEKALTAIALLMALFHTKPSPFCILDEVDAPLDDPNTVRFVQVLEEMAQNTQFLVITHNKLTMQACQTLYGVTMQERGVSQTVSVDLDEVQPEEALATA